MQELYGASGILVIIAIVSALKPLTAKLGAEGDWHLLIALGVGVAWNVSLWAAGTPGTLAAALVWGVVSGLAAGKGYDSIAPLVPALRGSQGGESASSARIAGLAEPPADALAAHTPSGDFKA